MIINPTRLLLASLASCVITASLMTALTLPAATLPLVLAVSFLAAERAMTGAARGIEVGDLSTLEKGLLAAALAIGLLRLGPYAWQYAAGVLVAPVTWDDNWHVQELASLVNAERYPPRLNFAPDAYFHFYYVPWMPAAALSSLLLTLTGAPMIKLSYALGALILLLGIAWGVIVIVRHICSEAARPWALGCLAVAGAGVDGVFALLHFAVGGAPFHAEWWQAGFGVANSFSSFSTALIWVPHHLVGALALLMAAVVVTEPATLRLRDEPGCYALAGLLAACSAFSSIFAFTGGLIALTPLLWDLARSPDRRLGLLCGGFLLPALPLTYIYLGADARGGFVIGQAFTAWSVGGGAAGIAGLTVAFVLMMIEVGFLFAVGRALDRGGADAVRLRSIAIAAALMLASTAVIGFTGSNNWALRATIVPVLLLACYAGRGLAVAPDARVVKAGAVALSLAVLAHANEALLLTIASARSPGYAAESEACKRAILAANRDRSAPVGALDSCRDPLSRYHLERSFVKAPLSPEDRELMGRGWGFLSVR